MQKREIIDRMAARTGLTKKDCELAMDALFQTLGDVLAGGGRMAVNGFGTFETRERAARTARNPRTGEPMPLPAATVPVFRPGLLQLCLIGAERLQHRPDTLPPQRRQAPVVFQQLPFPLGEHLTAGLKTVLKQCVGICLQTVE